MVCALDSNGLGLSPGQGSALCSWIRHFTFTVPLYCSDDHNHYFFSLSFRFFYSPYFQRTFSLANYWNGKKINKY